VIDLHTHTAASDGRLTATDLVRQAWQAGIRVLAITDHDTLGGLDEAARAASQFGLRLIDGVEVTAVERARDVHVLGYFVDRTHGGFQAFLASQRDSRVTRAREIGRALASLGAPIDVDRLLSKSAEADVAVGRLSIAVALVDAGHVKTVPEAFDRFLGNRGAAFVPRTGPTVVDVIGRIHDAGGVASLAHPVHNRADDRIAEWKSAGLDAIEVYHSDHDGVARDRYLQLAAQCNLAVTGGSDYHGDERAERARLGRVTLPDAELERLCRLRP
jgi:predicted metal-dependent phosphoesterase TrpH